MTTSCFPYLAFLGTLFFPVLSFFRTEIFYNLVIIRLIQVEILTLLQRLIADVSLTKAVSIYRYCLKLYAKSPSAYRLLQRVLVLSAPRLLRSERNKSEYLQIGMQMEVVSRIKSAVAASSEKRCDTMVAIVLVAYSSIFCNFS